MIEDNSSKCQIICKPEQSGKTFLMIQEIIKNVSIDNKEIINFIFCDNNLLLIKQTCSRLDNKIEYIEFSSDKKTDYKTSELVFDAIINKDIRNIVCCANDIRLRDIYKIINNLNTNKFTKNQFHINIWLDEADQFIKYIDDYLIPLINKYSDINVKLITATPEPLLKKYKYINIFPIENTTTEDYHGWEDNRIKLYEKKDTCIGFIVNVLKEQSKRIKSKSIWFIPGEKNIKTHEEIKDICHTYKMAVICVNSNGISLSLPLQEPIIYDKTDEFSKQIVSIYKTHNLCKYPLAITGYICIGRGVTINSKEFMIHYAILSQDKNKEEASQLAGRLKGNIKKFIKKLPLIFTTENFNNIAIEYEKKSRNLAEIAYKNIKNTSNITTI